jgi:hypothetical protein
LRFLLCLETTASPPALFAFCAAALLLMCSAFEFFSIIDKILTPSRVLVNTKLHSSTILYFDFIFGRKRYNLGLFDQNARLTNDRIKVKIINDLFIEEFSAKTLGFSIALCAQRHK